MSCKTERPRRGRSTVQLWEQSKMMTVYYAAFVAAYAFVVAVVAGVF